MPFMMNLFIQISILLAEVPDATWGEIKKIFT